MGKVEGFGVYRFFKDDLNFFQFFSEFRGRREGLIGEGRGREGDREGWVRFWRVGGVWGLNVN